MKFLEETFKDKEGRPSGREVTAFVAFAAMLVAWVSHQFFAFECPEFMFYGFGMLAGVSFAGYSFERGHRRRSQDFENYERTPYTGE